MCLTEVRCMIRAGLEMFTLTLCSGRKANCMRPLLWAHTFLQPFSEDISWHLHLVEAPADNSCSPLAFTKGLTGADLPAVPLSSCTPLHSLENTSVPGVVRHQSHSHIPLGKLIVDSLAFQEYWEIICCLCLTIVRHFISISEFGLAAACFPLVVISPKWWRRTRAVQQFSSRSHRKAELQLLIKPAIAEDQHEKQCQACIPPDSSMWLWEHPFW